MRTLCLVLCLLIGAPVLQAASPAPAEINLGHGLRYFRIHALPADLPVGPAKRGGLVLDLRYCQGNDDAASALGAWLRSHASATAPVIVLLNADTAPAALAYFTAHDPAAGVITIGSSSARFEPDLVVKFGGPAERTAYDAFEHGTPLESLVTETAVKARHDEASMALERSSTAEDAPAPDTDLAEQPDAKPPTPAVPPPVIDYVLLRAVQVHRALVALRKL